MWHEDRFRQYIPPDAVAIVPTTHGRLEGREAYVTGWQGFAEAAVIPEWKKTDHNMQIYAGKKMCRGHDPLLDNVRQGRSEADEARP